MQWEGIEGRRKQKMDYREIVKEKYNKCKIVG